MKKSISWKGATGSDLRIEAEYVEEMRPTTADLDGDIITKPSEPLPVISKVTIYKDDAPVDSIRDSGFWHCIPRPDLKAKGVTHTIGKAGILSAELAARIDRMLHEVIRGGQAEDPAVAEYYRAREAAKAEQARAEARRILEKAERCPRKSNGALMSDKEAAAWRRAYNNVMNEGGYGYVPEVITQEQYDAAAKVLGE